ncbi:MAG: hypothetical protein FJ077_13460 [Cyanobacteria bacterium K_DeepCast_35m_m2_023]|nr:hypothetical protein [Cyanobacteria bacterium K_DeepCast_35m_m2_023]
MAADPLDTLRLKLMQDVLPVGVAVVERARKGGIKDVVSAFSQPGPGQDPLTQLRDEGEPLARQLRDGLDRLSPGLGNPVMRVDVRVESDPSGAAPSPADDAELVARLQAIEHRLVVLEQQLGSR